MSTIGWFLVLVLGGALPFLPALMRPELGRPAKLKLAAAVLAVDVLLAATTVWALRSWGGL